MNSTNQYPGVDQAFFIKVNNRLIKIKSLDIYLVKSIGDYVRIYTADQQYTLRSTLKSIINKLPVNVFYTSSPILHCQGRQNYCYK